MVEHIEVRHNLQYIKYRSEDGSRLLGGTVFCMKLWLNSTEQLHSWYWLQQHLESKVKMAWCKVCWKHFEQRREPQATKIWQLCQLRHWLSETVNCTGGKEEDCQREAAGEYRMLAAGQLLFDA